MKTTTLSAPGVVSGSSALDLLQASPAVAYLATLAAGDSRETTCRTLKQIARFLGGDFRTFDWASLRYAHMAALRSYVQGHYAPATANRWLNTVRGVLKTAWRMGLMTLEECESARIAPVPGERLPAGRDVKTSEIRALLEAASVARFRKTAARNVAIVALLYGAGLRRCDLVRADAERFHGTSLTVIGKGNKERLVPLPVGTAQAVQEWMRIRGSAPGPLILATTADGQLVRGLRMGRDNLNALLDRLAERAGVVPLSPHDLRRSYIGDLLDAGADLVTVKDLVGHANVNTTAKYDRRGQRTKARAASLLHVPYADPKDKLCRPPQLGLFDEP